MKTVGAYLLSVCTVAVLCGLARRFSGGKGTAAAVQLLTGAILTLTVLKPLGNLEGKWLDKIEFDFSSAAETAVSRGQAQAQNTLAQLIKEETSAYILQRAKELNVTVTVSVEVSNDALPVPTKVRMNGNVSPYARQRLQSLICSELGIAKEDQIWT